VLLSPKEKLPYPALDGTDTAGGEGYLEALAKAIDARLTEFAADITELQNRIGQFAYMSSPDVVSAGSGGTWNGVNATLYDTIGNEPGWDVMETYRNDDPRARFPEAWYLTAGMYVTWAAPEQNDTAFEMSLEAHEQDPVTGNYTSQVSYKAQDKLVAGTGGVNLTLEVLHVARSRNSFNFYVMNNASTDATVQTAWCSMTRIRDFPG
jgi:hypothetical protein